MQSIRFVAMVCLVMMGNAWAGNAARLGMFEGATDIGRQVTLERPSSEARAASTSSREAARISGAMWMRFTLSGVSSPAMSP